MKNNKILIIAEAGINHNGNLKKAYKLIEAASNSGANIIKFQTFITENLVTKKAKRARYQIKNTRSNESQFKMLKKLEINKKFHIKLIKHCNKMKIDFLSSPFDLNSINLLNKLNLKMLKVPSGELTNLPYLRAIGKLNKKIILSTGMATLNEIKTALKVIINSGTKKENITILHCTSEYPAPMNVINLKAMLTIKKECNVSIGYSDHTNGIEIPIAATALGAKVIEKHITLDKKLKGPDHLISLKPDEFKKMVAAIRNIEICLGDGVKKPTKNELINMKNIRKSIYASRYIKKDDLLDPTNITIKRPATGTSPMFWDKYIGKRAKKNYKIDDIIK